MTVFGHADRVLGRGGAADDRVQVAVGGRLEREPVRLAVAAEPGTGSGCLAEVLADHRVLVGRVEALVTDLEGVAEATGDPVAPVLGRARRVVELVRRLADVGVLRRHRVTEGLQLGLVDREAGGGDGRGTQHQVAVGVVGDHHRHRALGDELADRVALGLAAGTVAAEGVARPDRARAAAAPEAGVVAVEVGAAQASGEVVVARPGRVLRRGVDRDRAVLALHLVVEGGEVAERRGSRARS